ncbi:MAG TPA: cytochrome c biogenesis protein CcsA, partial [Microthrixaceae bacterium]|nr:cytochrome c biogenesis protein CcsA [Microthrixaceae bacterium]
MDWLGVTALSVATLAGLVLILRPRSGTAVAFGLAGFWAALVVLAWRFVSVDLRLGEVASLSRDELSWPLRLAGVWAGPAGSILLWSTLLVSIAAIAVGRSPASTDDETSGWVRRRQILGAASAVCGMAVIFIAQTFDRLGEPAVRGVGLNPVLEHWAMVIHPPLLYTAQAMVVGAALVWRRNDPDARRRWTTLAASLLLSATLLGSWWAHDELGWGGWWAWDPVENTALAPLLALIASLHMRSSINSLRWNRIAAAAVFAGIAVTRSGLPSSVHAFASGGGVAPLFAVAAAMVAASAAFVRNDPAAANSSPGKWSPRVLGERVTAGAAGWTLIVIGSGSLTAMWLGTRTPVGTIDGKILGTLFIPVGVSILTGVIGFGFRRRQKPTSMLAHLGVVLFGVGVIGSLLGTSETSNVRFGQPTIINDSQITLLGTTVDESRPDATRADIRASIDG